MARKNENSSQFRHFEECYLNEVSLAAMVMKLNVLLGIAESFEDERDNIAPQPAMQPPQSYSIEEERSCGNLQASLQATGQSTGVGSGIAWTRTSDLQAMGRIMHSTWSAFTGCAT
ncbi:UNVERIFIED_CONTAM: hypothetical protein FKN15_025417 [Acipenser sinensis]